MIGAIVGDMVGSVYEFNNYKATDFEPLFHPRSKFTDDTVCTIAVADGVLNKKTATDALREWGHRYWSNGGWGQRFAYWLAADDPQPYGSFGNGSAMRISSVAWLATSYEHAMELSDEFTGVTHDHPEGIKAARATVSAIWWAREGRSAIDIRKALETEFGYDMSRDTDYIRPHYGHTEAAQWSVPEVLICALEGDSFEEAIRLAISIGGDSDTIAAIAGSVAEARFGIPRHIQDEAIAKLPEDMQQVVKKYRKALRG